FAHPVALHHHSGHADNIGPRAPVKIDWFDVFIDDRDAVFVRGKGGQQRKRRNRHVGTLAHERERVLKAAERNLKSWIDADVLPHSPLPPSDFEASTSAHQCRRTIGVSAYLRKRPAFTQTPRRRQRSGPPER